MKYVKRRAEAANIKMKDVSKKGVGYDYELLHPSGKLEKS